MSAICRIATAAAFLMLVGCGGTSDGIGGTTTVVPSTVQSVQGGAFTLSVFAEAPGKLRPDDLLEMGSTLFVVYQDNNDNPDGTIATGVTSAQSQVLEYDMNGNVLQTFNVPGHPDGLLAYNATTVWVSSNEDANPLITVIDLSTNTAKTVKSDVATLPHGGGLDDMKLLGGNVYASGSNPTLTTSPVPNLAPYSTDANGSTAANGVSTQAALYSISLNADGTTFHATPVLMSSTPATLLPANVPVTLNMTDPDSSAISPDGDLVTVSQQDSEIVYIHGLDTTSPSVSVLLVTLDGTPWPLDDVRWSPATGNSFMLLADNKDRLVYRIDATAGFGSNTAYGTGQGNVVKIDTNTGVLSAIYVGMNAPHGLIFVHE